MLIREARFEELDEVLKLYKDIGGDEEIPKEKVNMIWDKIQNYPYFKILVAEIDNRIIGTYCIVAIDNLGHSGTPLAVVESVVVHPDFRSQGIGKEMMIDAMNRAASQGCYKLMLSSNHKRVRAHKFYEDLGFEQHGISFMVEVHKND